VAIHPHTLAFVYFLYLAIVGVVRGGARARRASVVALVVTSALSRLVESQVTTPAGFLLAQTWPLLLLFVGYRIAGAFYERPDLALEARLLAIDRRIGARLEAAPRALSALLEAAYVCVYLVIPAGAAFLLWKVSADAAAQFWTTVLVAGFVCYGALPWVQTRPPRAIEGGVRVEAPRFLRRLNLLILERGSVGVNTLPSGHAATAVAVALSVWSYAPLAGACFLVIATLICVATVAGRYHYFVDTLLGALVGVGAWLLLT
jgi:membrane-associated phospholipid phosphatase